MSQDTYMHNGVPYTELTKWGDEITADPTTGAKRANGGKTRYDLLPVLAMRDTAEIFGFGGRKYGDYNWAAGFEWSNPYQSMMRHLHAWWAGEDFDKESGMSHLAHAACNLMMLQHFEYHYPAGDDRPTNSYPDPRTKENQ